ncbi:MAG: hypothetical protein ACKUBY_02090 [Candidatus Moraniibacteriota bacterium]|jgi:hypothetical protein
MLPFLFVLKWELQIDFLEIDDILSILLIGSGVPMDGNYNYREFG